MPWENLDDDLAEVFGDYTRRQGEVDERMGDWSARRYARAERKRDEMRRRRGSTPLSIARRRRIYATDYEQVELPIMAKILKAPVKAIPVADRSQRCVVRIPGVKVRAHGTIATHVLGEHPICEKHFERILEGVHYGAHPNGELISAKLPVRRL